jgi:arginase
VERLAAADRAARVSILETSSTLWPTEIGVAFDLARQIATRVRGTLSQGGFPIILSGNCLPAAIGACSGANDVSRVIWFDAHGDFNTPDTTISGFLDGMALAALTGHCWGALTATIDGFSIAPEATVTLIGARDLDPLEANALAASQITRLSAHDLGAGSSLLTGTGSAYLHIDLDVLDPSEGPMNGYAAPGGMTRLQLHEAMRRCGPVRVASVTAFDPAVDPSGSSLETALNVCVDLALLR